MAVHERRERTFARSARCGTAIAIWLVGCQVPTGDLNPGPVYSRTELATTALPVPFSQDLCGNPPGVAELFVGGGNDFMLRARTDQLGVSSEVSFLPAPADTLICDTLSFPVYRSITDHDMSRLPDGRLVQMALASKRGALPGTICLDNLLPEIERALLVRVSDDCGANWYVANVLDVSGMSISGPPHDFLDRPNLFVDSDEEMMYISVRAAQTTGPDNRQVVLGAPTTFPALGAPTWSTVVSFPNGAANTVLTADPGDNSEILWLFQCVDNRPFVALIFDPKSTYPFGTRAAPVLFPSPFPPDCSIVEGPLTGAQLFNLVEQLSIAPLGDPVNSFRIVYPEAIALNGTAFQIAHVVDFEVTFPPPSPFPLANVVAVDSPLLNAAAQGRHVLWPDLVWPRGFETNPAHRYQQVLTWVEVAETGLGPVVGQRTRSIVWRPDVQLYFDLGILAFSVINGNQLAPLGDSKFFGDYKYGTFIQGPADRAVFFAPWSQTMIGDVAPSGRIFGALVLP